MRTENIGLHKDEQGILYMVVADIQQTTGVFGGNMITRDLSKSYRTECGIELNSSKGGFTSLDGLSLTPAQADSIIKGAQSPFSFASTLANLSNLVHVFSSMSD